LKKKVIEYVYDIVTGERDIRAGYRGEGPGLPTKEEQRVTEGPMEGVGVNCKVNVQRRQLLARRISFSNCMFSGTRLKNPQFDYANFLLSHCPRALSLCFDLQCFKKTAVCYQSRMVHHSLGSSVCFRSHAQTMANVPIVWLILKQGEWINGVFFGAKWSRFAAKCYESACS
jgi:hypothetical protein